mgnify:CR=1 FL=1
MNQRARYPFSAIVGQDRMRRALILNAVYPRIGGVLIRGERGTAKSTAARALAARLIVASATAWFDPTRCPVFPAGRLCRMQHAAHIRSCSVILYRLLGQHRAAQSDSLFTM